MIGYDARCTRNLQGLFIMPSLTIVSGPNSGDYYPVGVRTLVIGRDEGCSAQVVDDKVSRKHVQIRHDNGRYILTDMKSANGTLINERKVSGEIPLADGDEISIGASKLLFSTQDFKDRESAVAHWKQRGQRGKPTLLP